ncbi:hypothetical protein CQW23_30886 [Capsicum baccatum]|uniref:Uncharacterized protein n=1 Tax=Capsicum baccatum TaxID=33114 RepID=A0A2G2V971_CAPBA|nr:hypothetical protein CQW23_30886 [Capsicum baccatum]
MFMRFNPQTLKDAIKIAGMQQKALGAVEKMGKRSARDVKPITRPFTPKKSNVRNLEIFCLESLFGNDDEGGENLFYQKFMPRERLVAVCPNFHIIIGFSLRQLTIIGVANDVGENVGILPGQACNKFPPWVILLVGVCLSFFGYGVLWIAVSQIVLSLPYWVVGLVVYDSEFSVGVWSLHGDGVVTKGKGYGIHSIRVDGNDSLVVFTTVQDARKIAFNEHKPVLVEDAGKFKTLGKEECWCDKRHQYKGKVIFKGNI